MSSSSVVCTTDVTWAMEREYILAADELYTKIMCETDRRLCQVTTEEEIARVIANANKRLERKATVLRERYHMVGW